MASNPMQRKSKLAFILGMLTAVLIAAVVIMLLLMQIRKVKKEKEDLAATFPTMATVYTVSEKVNKDGEIPELTSMQVISSTVPENALTTENLQDEEGNLKVFKALIDIEPNTVITDTMVEENAEKTDSLRLIEYNMITLPSTLEAGQYIDIRIAFSTGADFVVASKKYVEDANSSTIWLKIGEKDLLTINSAIIESYIIEGTKVYATIYTDGTQSQSVNTYTPNETVQSIIKQNSKIDINSPIGMRAFVESLLEGKTQDERDASVEEGFNTEEQNLKSAREEFLGEIGY